MTLGAETNLQSIGGGAWLDNAGSVLMPGGGTARILMNVYGLGGVSAVSGGEHGLDRDVQGVGLIDIDAGALVSMASDGFVTDWSGTVTGDGDLWLGKGRQASFSGIYGLGGWIHLDSNATVDFVVPVETGSMRFRDTSGATRVSGSLLVHDQLLREGGVVLGGELTLGGQGWIGQAAGVPVLDGGRFVLLGGADVIVDGAGLRARNSGEIESQGRLELRDANLSVTGAGTFRNLGRFEKLSGSSIVWMDFENEGQMVLDAAVVQFRGDHMQSAGRTLLLDGEVELRNGAIFGLLGGKLAGTGLIDGPLHVGPGGMPNPGMRDPNGVIHGELRVEGGNLIQDSGYGPGSPYPEHPVVLTGRVPRASVGAR